MRCDAAAPLLPEYDQGALAPRLRQRVEAHLERCPRCRQAMDGDRHLVQVLQSWQPPSLAPDLGHRLDARLAARERASQPRTRPFAAWRWALAAGAAAGLALLAPAGLRHLAGSPARTPAIIATGPSAAAGFNSARPHPMIASVPLEVTAVPPAPAFPSLGPAASAPPGTGAELGSHPSSVPAAPAQSRLPAGSPRLTLPGSGGRDASHRAARPVQRPIRAPALAPAWLASVPRHAHAFLPSAPRPSASLPRHSRRRVLPRPHGPSAAESGTMLAMGTASAPASPLAASDAPAVNVNSGGSVEVLKTTAANGWITALSDTPSGRHETMIAPGAAPGISDTTVGTSSVNVE